MEVSLLESKSTKKLLCTAHPDGAEGFCGGLIARAVDDHGVEGGLLDCGLGGAGGRCYNTTPARALFENLSNTGTQHCVRVVCTAYEYITKYYTKYYITVD